MSTSEHHLTGVRYLVDDVGAAVGFYTAHLGFTGPEVAAPAFADVTRDGLRLLLSGPASSGARAVPGGRTAGSAAWNRVHLVVADLTAETERLRAAGVHVLTDVVSGPGGRQVLVADPSGNPVELFQPR